MSSHDKFSENLVDLNAINNERITAGALGVLQTSCSGCHSPTSTTVTPIPDILDVDALVAADWIVPGEPQNSPVYLAMVDGLMPHNGEISASDRQLVRDWIIVLGGGDPNATPNAPPALPPGTPPPGGGPSGTVLYNTYCASCHGVGAASTKRGRSAAQITNAISNIGQMVGLQGQLTPAQIQAIADYLGSI
ncbi:MAG: c-type cytochrome [Bdellovibrionales bacterium]|nr:c-type cytochrome [Bdellovibrionales bacterium]